MAKAKKQAVKTPKKHSPKYSKIAATCSKELAAKKKALATAEKALAKAQRTHSELLSEVARLDMLDRSLNALINGTEPPQNVRYVYTYPQWVWYPHNGYGWNWNGNAYSVTLGAQSGGNYNFQGGQFTTSNAGTSNAFTVTTPAAICNVSNAGSLSVPSSSLSVNCSDSSLMGYTSGGLDSAVLTSTAAPSWQTFTTTTTPAPAGAGDLTVDLSTGAGDPEAEPKEAAEAPAEGGDAEEKQ
jgi:hypothetical protein